MISGLDFGLWGVFEIQVLVLGRHTIEYSELLFTELYFGDYFKLLGTHQNLGYTILLLYINFYR